MHGCMLPRRYPVTECAAAANSYLVDIFNSAPIP